jgi:metallo-beta-lactamase family protein
MLYFIRQIKEKKLVKGHGDFPVYVDSPLAIEATTVFQRHPDDCYDEEAGALIQQGINPLAFTNLHTAVTADDSKEINFIDEPKVIISASGMCDAGRVKHHLKHNLWRRECTILFVGYQSVGTPGRAIVDGADTVKLFGEEIAVRAEIAILPGISGHADDRGLMKWASAFTVKPSRYFICHGEDSVTDFFANRLKNELCVDACAPFSGWEFDLKNNVFLAQPAGVRIAAETGETLAKRKKNAVFDRLVAAGQRLMAVIRRNEGGANKDLAKFADQINALSDRWDR